MSIVPYNSTLSFLSSLIVLVGSLNWGFDKFLRINLVEYANNKTVKKPEFEKVVYALVSLCALYLLTQRNFFLPFLGNTVLPPSLFKPTQQEKYDQMVLLNVPDEKAEYVVYWAAEPKDTNTIDVKNWEGAYNKFSNYGVSSIVDGQAKLFIQCPQQYTVKKFGVKKSLLPKHLHYRIVQSTGMLTEIRTINLNEQCK